MPISLSKDHRRLLENTTKAARVLAESACRAALENLAVHEKMFRSHMSDEQKKTRNNLRARGRALGDKRDERSGIQDIRHLTELAAYEHWHRLLFTRFLTENHLLITDEARGSVPVTLEECEELAPELGARDGLDLACRFARLTLPGVFRRDDPVLDLPIALNDQVELRKLLAALPSEAFRADDALGWTYQFWQAQLRKEVNDSGKKIGADELAPVTQLFTEDYMVEFLLHNTLGAWWAGKIGPIKADTEEEARAQAALPARDGVPAISWTYLRFVQDETTKTWLPAAGTFDAWPKFARLIRLLDPCMGSGHFLVFALPMLVRLRMEEEKFSAQAAVVAVLKDNLHGLELDERCTQIAAFNVALTAWKLAGYQALPSLNLACSGLAPSATEAEWVGLAGDNSRARNGMARLHRLFKDAPVLGSLINPRSQGGNLIEAEFHELAPLLTAALALSETQKAKFENDAIEQTVIAQGLAKAAELLAGQFTLVVTNVPFLARGKQIEMLKDFCEERYPMSMGDLSTVFIERLNELCFNGCTIAFVSPEQWFFTQTYKKFRELLLRATKWRLVAKLGPAAFQIMNWWAARTILLVITNVLPEENHRVGVANLPYSKNTEDKPPQLLNVSLGWFGQLEQLKNPDGRVRLAEFEDLDLLNDFADVHAGIQTGDLPKYVRGFFEFPKKLDQWEYQLRTVNEADPFAGRTLMLFWDHGRALADEPQAVIRGTKALGKRGVCINRTASLAPTLYFGEVFDQNGAVVIPHNNDHLDALWCLVSSGEYAPAVRELDNNTGVTPATLTKIPFDLAHWQKVAAEKYPDGLPKPHSNDPTQWLFNGHPAGSTQPLHVAVARLLGYRWPRQTGSSFPDCPALGPDGLDSFADKDGIVCLPPVNREQPAAARLRQLLTAALGTFDERALIAAAGFKGSKSKTLEDWLRDEFFEQHARLFHDRPFIWHLWDGRPDGFHSLVNYHKLDHATLQKLTYSYLGNWIQQQSDDAKADKPGAAERLGAARALQAKLAAILEGEAPLDIFVRWKPLKEQAQGWHPDLNDGIHQNIRPFLLAGDVGKKGAGLFRTVPLTLKDKDRGTEPTRPKEDYPWFWCEEEPGTDPTGGKDFIGNRWNNVHHTLARKQKASS
jgi:hypothetical protein